MKHVLFAVFAAIGLAASAQSLPTFVSSSTTTTFAVNSKDDVKHIIFARTVTPEEMYSYIDSGLIGDKKYQYYINHERTLVVGVPSESPSVAYVISICDYESQGGWATDGYIDYMKQLCNCE